MWLEYIYLLTYMKYKNDVTPTPTSSFRLDSFQQPRCFPLSPENGKFKGRLTGLVYQRRVGTTTQKAADRLTVSMPCSEHQGGPTSVVPEVDISASIEKPNKSVPTHDNGNIVASPEKKLTWGISGYLGIYVAPL